MQSSWSSFKYSEYWDLKFSPSRLTLTQASLRIFCPIRCYYYLSILSPFFIFNTSVICILVCYSVFNQSANCFNSNILYWQRCEDTGTPTRGCRCILEKNLKVHWISISPPRNLASKSTPIPWKVYEWKDINGTNFLHYKDGQINHSLFTQWKTGQLLKHCAIQLDMQDIQ